MVWFQCEDCGENLKKPKLPNHFRVCSAHKFSCIDCNKYFDRDSVQSHTQCITEAEKYGPKDGKGVKTPQSKPDKPKVNADVDVNVGLSTRPPWSCSLCNTKTTSQQTLQLHADGKKHRAKAKAFHASQKQSDQAAEPTPNLDIATQKANVTVTVNETKDNTVDGRILENQASLKRKVDASDGAMAEDNERTGVHGNGEVIQAKQLDTSQKQPKRRKHAEDDTNGTNEKGASHKIKWKKLVTSTLESTPEKKMKIKKLQKIVMKTLQEAGVAEDKSQLCQTLMEKVKSSSRFVVDDKKVWLASKA